MVIAIPTLRLIVFTIEMVFGAVLQIMMNVEFVVEIIVHVKIGRVSQMVQI